MRLDDFDFDLPADRIALRPASPRDSARLLQVGADGGLTDHLVRDLPALLRPGDLMVFNDTRVLPARLFGRRVREASLVAIEATLHRRLAPEQWTAFLKPGRRVSPGDVITFGGESDRACSLTDLTARVISKGEGGEVTLAFNLSGVDLDLAVNAIGAMPLPPYIAGKRPADERDFEDYQTVYAREAGSVAAPTAGLHFTASLLEALNARGVEQSFVTLHVGAGTFLPVKTDQIEEHKMHAEWGVVGAATVEAVAATRARGGRVIAVGTTALRLLESAARGSGTLLEWRGETDIFIKPGFRFAVADGLMTNFHLPKSTLFMLVCAFAGSEAMHEAYRHAISNEYRFYSYGDSSLLWRRG